MKAINLSIGVLAVFLGTSVSAQAGLLGGAQSFPDASLSPVYLFEVSGFHIANGKAFKASWTKEAADHYSGIPPTLSPFSNGSFEAGLDGIKIRNNVGFTTQNFGNDWLFGTSVATSAFINGHLIESIASKKTNSSTHDDAESDIDGEITPPKREDHADLEDTFVEQPVPAVPEPEAFLLVSVGLATTVLIARRRRVSSDTAA